MHPPDTNDDRCAGGRFTHLLCPPDTNDDRWILLAIVVPSPAPSRLMEPPSTCARNVCRNSRGSLA